MKKILISGGTSYLGQNLINYLAKNNKVTALVRDKNRFSIIDKNIQFQIIKIDKDLNNKLKENEYDIYINLISNNNKIRSFVALIESIKSNIFFNRKVLSLLIRSNTKKIIQINSYWQLLKGIDSRKYSLYVFGKNYISKYLDMNKGRFSYELYNFYLGDIYGKQDFRKKLIPELLKNKNLVIKNERSLFFPDHVDDIALSIEKCINQDLKEGKYITFNECFSVKDISDIVTKLNSLKNSYEKLNVEKFLNLDFVEVAIENKQSIFEKIKDIDC